MTYVLDSHSTVPTGQGKADATSPISSPDKVVEAINRGILQRRYPPGYRLVEADLARSLNVGRGTVREALKKLAAQGVVRISPNRGASIRPLNRDEAKNLISVLEVLCGLAARLAAQRIDEPGARKRFKAASELLTNTPLSPTSESFLTNRSEYYAVLLDLAGNPELDRLMPIPQIHLFRSQFQSYLSLKDLQDMRKEYVEISAAVLQAKATVAEARMKRHIHQTLDRLASIGEEAFDQPA